MPINFKSRAIQRWTAREIMTKTRLDIQGVQGYIAANPDHFPEADVLNESLTTADEAVTRALEALERTQDHRPE